MTSSAISNAITAGNALMSKLAATAAANAQSMVNYRLTLVGNQLTAQLNKKIAQLQAQSQDPMVPILQQQATQLTQQQTNYSNAQSQISQNSNVLGDLVDQLGTMATAAQAGDSTTFDQSLTAVNDDIASLQVVTFVPGLQPDGVVPLKTNGIGVGSSASYDLSTSTGQTQALSDVQNAENLIQQMMTASRENEQLTASVTTSLQGQLTAISNQISNLQDTELAQASDEISTLKQQTQTEYHLIELDFGNVGQSASVMTSVQSYAQLTQVQAGTTLSILTGTSGEPSLFVADLTSPSTIGTVNGSSTSSSSSASSSQSGSSSTGQILSTSA